MLVAANDHDVTIDPPAKTRGGEMIRLKRKLLLESPFSITLCKRMISWKLFFTHWTVKIELNPHVHAFHSEERFLRPTTPNHTHTHTHTHTDILT